MKSRTRMGVTQTQRLQLSTSLHAALRLLRADAAGLARYLEEQAAETPALILREAMPAPGEWLPRWSGVLPRGEGPPIEALAAQGPSLIAHVLDALPGLVPAGPGRRIAIALAEALEPSGWLGRPVARIAADLAAPVAQVETVLAQMQQIEPTGLFARDLTDCLRLQAQEAGVLDPVMAQMLSRLDLVGSGDWPRLAKLAHVDEAAIVRAFRHIRSFNPKPGTAFSAVSSPLREPDLTVRQGAEGWEISLNRAALPTLSVDDTATGAAHARSVLRLVESRNATLLLVGQTVLLHQRAALETGPAALRPLTMQAVADTLQMHKSTISRVVAGTAVDTPHGTWWLRALFSADMGSEIGAAALRSRLAQIVAAEDPAHPLSDDQLATVLAADGAEVARRTVAKYRTAMRIPPAGRRRSRPN